MTGGQVAPYARSWEDANRLAREVVGPLWVALGDSAAQGVGADSYDQGHVGQLRRLLEARDGIPSRVINPNAVGGEEDTSLRRGAGLDRAAIEG